DVSVDSTPVPVQGNYKVVKGNLARRIWSSQDDFPQLTFEVHDIEMLKSLSACVNDICINGCIPLLFS
ncbi:hypothetical protein BS17DRAFT_672239, partial [Gyrodon lividus]